jgi:hypothetical protein
MSSGQGGGILPATGENAETAAEEGSGLLIRALDLGALDSLD